MSRSAPVSNLRDAHQRASAASRKVGVLAGGGSLPLVVAESVAARGETVHIVAIRGAANQEIARFPHTWVDLGQIGRIVATLRGEGVTDLVIAGTVRRPDLWKVRPDAGFFRSLPHVLGLLAGGDDSVLSRVVRFFEANGFTVRGAHEVASDLLAQPGLLGRMGLSLQDRSDASVGFAVREALGPLDAGQAVVVANGTVVAIEGAEGTDAMLERVTRLRRNGAGMRGVLAKGPKPGQELRVDMPAIGPRTVERAAGAGLAGIAVEAGGLLVLGREEAVRGADAAGIALEGLPRSVAMAATPDAAPASSRQGRLMSRRSPGRRDRRDLDIGLGVVDRLAPFRTGAAVVVSRAYILAVAAQEAPAAMLERVGALRQWGARGKRRVGVLVCRADQPADAAQVREICAQATRQGLAGIAVTGAPYVMDACEDAWRGAGVGDLFLALFRHSKEK